MAIQQRSGTIIDYQLIRRTTKDGLVKAVKEAIYQGWEPQGGVSHDGRYYCQAVIKRRV